MATDTGETGSTSGVVPLPNNSFFRPGSSLWTDVLPRNAHVDIFRHCDYSTTTLGPIQGWGPALRLYTTMVIADSRAACIYWGPDRVAAVYNEKFAPYCAGNHPFLMGKPFKIGFPEIYDQIWPLFDQACATAQAIDVEDMLLFIERNGYTEETYFIGQFIPVRGDSGEVEGLYNTVYESTARVLHERRRRIVESIAAILPHSVDDTLSLIIESLRGNPKDIPMAMLYAFDSVAPTGSINLTLRGSIGIPEGYEHAPAEADLETNHSGFIPYFRQVRLSGRPMVLRQSDGSLSAIQDALEGIAWCGFGEPARDIVVLPLTMGGDVLGFYVQGTNPRRAYDETTEMSIVDIARQMEAKWASSFSTEQSKLREQILERRASDSENRLRHMAQGAPVGMCQITPDRKIHWANDQFYDITGHDRTRPDMQDFFDDVMASEQVDVGTEKLEELLRGAPRIDREYRLKRAWSPPVEEGEDTTPSSTWILTSSFPLMENGRVKLIMGYVTDISHQKWAESVQERAAAAAVQAKRRQEEFIDTTSHEMRNPLTAITQLADSIRQSSLDAQDSQDGYRTVIQENVDAAKTILACAAHQKRVIDDVLTLSRLESEMLSITPVVEQPTKVLGDIIKMFEGESALQDVDIETVQDPSYQRLGVDYLWIDTSRLMQILINLLSNAIKFTAPQPERKVSVLYGAQAKRPPLISTPFGDMDWIPALESQRRNTPLSAADSQSNPLFLYFRIQDTGPGMTPDETEKLFKRYSQATPRTHITYGGSGLGLYICRQLAEKQGGGIGVSSRHGQGSAFAFYIAVTPATGSDVPRKAPATAPSKAGSSRPRISKRHSSSRKITEKDGKATPHDPASSPASARRKEQQQSPDEEKLHILLVEDNLVNQKVLAKQLRAANCAVTVANHGAEALQILEQADCWRRTPPSTTSAKNDTANAAPTTNGDIPPLLRIDVILMDWEMPVMNGLTCCARVREFEASGQITRHLAVVATTANVRREQREQAMAAGMDTVVAKPFTVRELLERVRETIRGGDGDGEG